MGYTATFVYSPKKVSRLMGRSIVGDLPPNAGVLFAVELQMGCGDRTPAGFRQHLSERSPSVTGQWARVAGQNRLVVRSSFGLAPCHQGPFGRGSLDLR